MKIIFRPNTDGSDRDNRGFKAEGVFQGDPRGYFDAMLKLNELPGFLSLRRTFVEIDLNSQVFRLRIPAAETQDQIEHEEVLTEIPLGFFLKQSLMTVRQEYLRFFAGDVAEKVFLSERTARVIRNITDKETCEFAYNTALEESGEDFANELGNIVCPAEKRLKISFAS